MMHSIRLDTPKAYTSRPIAPPGYCNGKSIGLHTAFGNIYPDRRWSLDLEIASGIVNKAGASFLHVHSDGGEHVLLYANANLYRYAATPVSIASSIPETFAPSFANMTEAGASLFLTASSAHVVREDSATTIEAVTHDMSAPAAPTVTSPATPGSWTARTIHVRVCWLDDAGTVIAYTAPSTATSESVSTNDDVTIGEPASAPSRATKWRYGISFIGDTPAGYVRWADNAVGSGTITLTSEPAAKTTQAFTDINGTYRQATFPISAPDICWVHDGRMFIAKTTLNKIAWSERNNLNHWYSTQVYDVGAESGGFAGPITGAASANGLIYVFTRTSCHVVYGSFRRDDEGVLRTFRVDVDSAVLQTGIGSVNHASITVQDGSVFFFSTRGPAVLRGSSVRLLLHEDFRHDLDGLDWAYASRICSTWNPVLNAVYWLVPRLTNSSRAFDGASTAGICDRVWRFDLAHGVRMPDLPLEATHILARTNPASQGGNGTETKVFAIGPYGGLLELDTGWSGGQGGDYSGATYDGLLATATTTTTATVTLAGVTADDFKHFVVVLFYPLVDTGFPGVFAIRTISTNTATSGGSVVISWAGALTVPTSTEWTVRIAAAPSFLDIRYDPADYIAIPPGYEAVLHQHQVLYEDAIGKESVA